MDTRRQWTCWSPRLLQQGMLRMLVTVMMMMMMLGPLDVSAKAVQEQIVISADQLLESSLTCWTCPEKANNQACNDWAPDMECPLNHTVCKTVHEFDKKTGMSLRVSKLCAKESDCSTDMIGCRPSSSQPGVQECVSCCGENYCNEMVPSNHSSAILLSTFPSQASSHWTATRVWTTILFCSVTWFSLTSVLTT